LFKGQLLKKICDLKKSYWEILKNSLNMLCWLIWEEMTSTELPYQPPQRQDPCYYPHVVKVDSLMEIERYSHVMHIVSKVSGTLRQDKTSFDAFRSIFPAGTLSGSLTLTESLLIDTGAPKIKAMELIAKLEKEKRGVYGGAIGYFSFHRGDIDTCIGIR